MDNNPVFSFQDLFNESTLNTTTIIANSVTAGTIVDTGLTASKWVGTDTSQTLESRTLNGTANQVLISNVGTTYTLALPQSIALTSTPTFTGLNLSGLTVSQLIATDASDNLISRTIAGTANQVVITTTGSNTVWSTPQDINTSSSPSFAGLTLSGLSVSLPLQLNGSHVVTSALINLTSAVTSVLPVANGGTNSSIALANGKLIISSAGALIEGTSSSSPTFTGLNLSGLTISQLIATDASDNLISRTIAGTVNQVVITTTGSNTVWSTPQDINTSSSPSFVGLTLSGLTVSLPLQLNGSHVVTSALINLTSAVTGILPVANGGTGGSSALTNGKLIVSSAGAMVEGTSSSNPSFTTLTTTATTNQILLGATTITNGNPSSGTWTIPAATLASDSFLGVQTTQLFKNKSMFTDTVFFVSKFDVTKQFGATINGMTTGVIAQLGCSASATCVYAIPDSGSDTFCMTAYAQTLTNKTLSGNTASNFVNSGTITLPTATCTLVGKDTTDILTNKTLSGNIAANFSNTGTITLPTATCTLVGKDTTDILTNKTLSGNIATNFSNSGTITLPSGTDTLVARATTDTLTNKTLDYSTCTFANSTKKIKFDPTLNSSSVTTTIASNDSASTTYTLPATAGTGGNIVIDSASQYLQSKNLAANTSFIVNAIDNTIRIGFSLTGTTGKTITIAGAPTNNRTISIPDVTTTLVGTDNTQTITGKTFGDDIVGSASILSITKNSQTLTITPGVKQNVANSAYTTYEMGGTQTHYFWDNLECSDAFTCGGAASVTNTTASTSTTTGCLKLSGGLGLLKGIYMNGTLSNAGQPAFYAYRSTNASNVTGDGTTYTVIFDTTSYDQTSSFNTTTGTFTAPVTGKYLFQASIASGSYTGSHVNAFFDFVPSAGSSTRIFTGNPGVMRDSGNNCGLNGTTCMSLSINTTVTIQFTSGGGTKVVTLLGGTAPLGVWFAGFLLC